MILYSNLISIFSCSFNPNEVLSGTFHIHYKVWHLTQMLSDQVFELKFDDIYKYDALIIYRVMVFILVYPWPSIQFVTGNERLSFPRSYFIVRLT